ncbi:MAG TPA: MASE1 domain-containing protein, partial [Kofleriaceae bacterium]|nr:MASE1 domain-containing protein [Kofleriaceae bacterium]
MTSARDAGWVLVVAAAYAASAWLAHRLAIPPGYATAVWPAAGVAVACVLCLGVRRALPGIVLGSFAHNLLISFGGAAPVRAAVIAAAIAAGAGAQAAVAGVVVRRRVAQPLVLERDGDVLRLLLLAGPCACVIGASCGTLTLLLAGAVAPADGPFTWWTWWVGDTIGTVVFAPLLLTLVGRPRSAWRSRRVTVALPLAVGFAVVTAIFVRTRRWEAARLDDDLARVERGLRRAIERDLEAADAMAAIQQVEPSLDADAFETIAAPLVAHRFGIDALVWLPRTGTAALAVHDVFPRRTEAALLGRDLAATAAARD